MGRDWRIDYPWASLSGQVVFEPYSFPQKQNFYNFNIVMNGHPPDSSIHLLTNYYSRVGDYYRYFLSDLLTCKYASKQFIIIHYRPIVTILLRQILF